MRPLLMLAGTCLALAGCGGGDDYAPGTVTPPAASTAVPDSAITSSTALVGYLSVLAADQTVEPLTLPAADASTSETEEPLAI